MKEVSNVLWRLKQQGFTGYHFDMLEGESKETFSELFSLSTSSDPDMKRILDLEKKILSCIADAPTESEDEKRARIIKESQTSCRF